LKQLSLDKHLVMVYKNTSIGEYHQNPKGVKMIKLSKGIFIVLVLTLCFASACKKSSSTGGTSSGGTLILALNYEPDTMNVYSTHLMADVQTCVIEGLIIPNKDMQYVPVLAKEVPTIENGGIVLFDDGTMDIIYHLQENVKWHDGKPFTSADVKATWEALKNPDWEAEGKDGVDDIRDIDCPDNYTVICHYKYPVADYASTLFTFGIMPKHLIEGVDLNEQTGYNRNGFIGTGPYKFKEWKDGEYIELVRNENYWREGALMDGMIFKFIPDYNTQIIQLKTGEIHFAMGLPLDSFNEISAIPGYKVEAVLLNAWGHLDFNFKNPILGKELVVRQAIDLCVDKETMCRELLGGLAESIDSYWMNFDYYHNANLPKHEYNPQKAAQLLDAAGWKVGADGVRAKSGQRLEFRMIGRTNNVEENKISNVIEDELKRIGIIMNQDLMANSAMSGLRQLGNYDMKMHRWITGSPSRSLFYSNKAFMPFGVNDIWYDNQELSDLLALADKTLNQVERKKLLDRAQLMIYEDVVSIPIFNYSQLVVHTDKLKGFIPNPTNMTHFWNTRTWYLEK